MTTLTRRRLSLVLQTGNVQGVYDDLVRLLDQADPQADQSAWS
ncbi:hypothetical protein [Streptomyces sp. SID13726]|nr:hypothetical protein [Streptomyces sp. SID13726]